MTRSSIRFPSAQSALAEGILSLQEDRAEMGVEYNYWAECLAPYQVILYSGDYHDEEWDGFDMLASAWACYDRTRLFPGDSLVLFDRESNVVVAQRGHTVDDEIDHCWSEHTRSQRHEQWVRDEFEYAWLTRQPIFGLDRQPYCQLWQ